jgi:glycosidase
MKLLPCAAALLTVMLAFPAQAGVAHVPWARAATVYEVNVRQFSQDSSLRAVSAQLPRLKAMGVDIVWLMPIYPIGVAQRKGTLGSYYAVRDYTAVNPEFGTLADLRALVATAHGLGMHVILDWVANHTAWDHPWVHDHPEWYKKNAKGELYPVTWNPDSPHPEYWTDVVGLDYSKRALWPAMTAAMAYWIRAADIDGFRCDVAGAVPTPFWEYARAELDKIKPVFMLAEAEQPDLHAAFDATYGWDSAQLLRKVARGQADARDLGAWLARAQAAWPADAWRLRFTSNHDFNSWDGSDSELYGPAFRPLAVLAATLPDLPLLYGGQEAGLDRRLAFFEKDPIDWKRYPLAPFYTSLFALKHANPALWNGSAGAPPEVLDTGNDKVFAFRRRQGSNVVTVAVNLSAVAQHFRLPETADNILPAWDYRITAKH